MLSRYLCDKQQYSPPQKGAFVSHVHSTNRSITTACPFYGLKHGLSDRNNDSLLVLWIITHLLFWYYLDSYRASTAPLGH